MTGPRSIHLERPFRRAIRVGPQPIWRGAASTNLPRPLAASSGRLEGSSTDHSAPRRALGTCAQPSHTTNAQKPSGNSQQTASCHRTVTEPSQPPELGRGPPEAPARLRRGGTARRGRAQPVGYIDGGVRCRVSQRQCAGSAGRASTDTMTSRCVPRVGASRVATAASAAAVQGARTAPSSPGASFAGTNRMAASRGDLRDETDRVLQPGTSDDWDDARLAIIEHLYPPGPERRLVA
jgi:hypothetical protein